MSWVQKLKDKLLLKNRAMKNQKVKVKQAVWMLMGRKKWQWATV
jgi:hypothetical protein